MSLLNSCFLHGDHAAHIRTQERERVQKILDGYATGILKPFVQQIAAAIRES